MSRGSWLFAAGLFVLLAPASTLHAESAPVTTIVGQPAETAEDGRAGGPERLSPADLPTRVRDPFGTPAGERAPLRQGLAPGATEPVQVPLVGGDRPVASGEGIEWGTGAPALPSAPRLLLLFGVTLGIVLLAWLWQRRRRPSGDDSAEGFRMEHVQSLRMGPHQTISLMRVGERTLLVGITQNQINVLADFGPDGSFERALDAERRAALEQYALGQIDALERRGRTEGEEERPPPRVEEAPSAARPRVRDTPWAAPVTGPAATSPRRRAASGIGREEGTNLTNPAGYDVASMLHSERERHVSRSEQAVAPEDVRTTGEQETAPMERAVRTPYRTTSPAAESGDGEMDSIRTALLRFGEGGR